ncbi:MAG: hypothetical protein M3372_02690 [Verrucomicrobiota bacterium]|nr:hypothetical protein [Verrucomicrobiota bacterium]
MPAAAPQFLELLEPASRGTLHFPQGLYAFESEDDTGYYYRAPRSVRQHSFGGSYPHDGGVFVRKTTPLHMRGYIYWASKRTKSATSRMCVTNSATDSHTRRLLCAAVFFQ